MHPDPHTYALQIFDGSETLAAVYTAAYAEAATAAATTERSPA